MLLLTEYVHGGVMLRMSKLSQIRDLLQGSEQLAAQVIRMNPNIFLLWLRQYSLQCELAQQAITLRRSGLVHSLFEKGTGSNWNQNFEKNGALERQDSLTS